MGSHTHTEGTMTVLEFTRHYISLLLVLYWGSDDRLTNSSETCSPFIRLRIQDVLDSNLTIFPRLITAVGRYERPTALSSAERTVFITTEFRSGSCPSILLSVLRNLHSVFQGEGELLFSLRSSSSCLHLLPLLLVPCIFPSKTCFITQFSLRKTLYTEKMQ